MWGYKNKLVRDLARWRDEGWLSADGEASILADLAKGGRGHGLASALGILASLLLAAAVISFVAAHWTDMSRLFRLALLFALLWVGYGASAWFQSRNMKMYADAAMLFATAMFGANIALISQLFHIDGYLPDGVLLWALGTTLAGVALRSNPALTLAMVLFCIWSGMLMGDTARPHWPFLIAWSAVAAVFVWQRWPPGAHIAGVALAGFVIWLGYVLDKRPHHEIVAVIGLAAAILAIALVRYKPDLNAIAGPMLGYGLVTCFAALFAMQFFDEITNAKLILLAAAALTLVLAAIWYGLGHAHRGALWLGYIGFSIEVLSLYAKTLGTLLDTSLFFMVAGLLVAGLSFLAWRLASRGETGSAII